MAFDESQHPRDYHGRWTDRLDAMGIGVHVWDEKQSKGLFADRAIALTKPDGTSAGHITLKKSLTHPDYLQVSNVALSPELKHKGLGAALYSRAVRLAHADGYKGIVASSQQTSDAKRLWDSLEKRGHASTIGGRHVITKPFVVFKK